MSAPKTGTLTAPPPGRSSIDPITTVTLLAPIRLDEHIGPLIAGNLPAEALPAYLHEATHHWCFFSPVGLGLTLLNLRARRRALVLEKHGECDWPETEGLDTIDVLDDYVRYDALMRAQAPLAEGLALFAEYDALPGSSRIVTDMMLSLASFSGGRDPGEDLWDQLARALQYERSRPTYAERKASLLTEGMALHHGGYLPGYLAVKGTWASAQAINRRLTDPDFFLNLLVNYVYCDFGLVAHLLDPRTCDAGAVTRIVDYLARRLAAFLPSITDASLDALETVAERPVLDEGISGTLESAFEEIPILATDPELVAEGRERLLRLNQELVAEANDPDNPLGGLPQYQQWTLEQRQFLCIGRLDVEVDIAGEGWARVWRQGRLLSSGRVTTGVTLAGRRAGSVELFVNPWRWGRYMAYAVSVDDRPVITWFSRDVAAALQRQFQNYRTNTATATSMSRLLAEFLEHQLMLDGTAEIVLSDARQGVADWASRFYVNAALPHVHVDRQPAVAVRMADEGFYPILGSMALIRALAWISLNWMTHSPDELAEAFADANEFHGVTGDLSSTVDAIAAAAQGAIGEPLVMFGPAGIVCTI